MQNNLKGYYSNDYELIHLTKKWPHLLDAQWSDDHFEKNTETLRRMLKKLEKSTFDQDGKRIKITEADYVEGEFIMSKVIPEGKKEMDWETYSK